MLPLLGMAAAGVINSMSQGSTNKANEMMGLEQMNWQKMMSDSAHTREVQDLKNAGLNPILSAGGGGASTPSGAAPVMQAPKIELPDMMAYGISMKQLEQADKKIQIDAANSASGIAKNLTDQQLTKAETILKKKGMIRADLEGDASKALKYIIDSVRKPSPDGRPFPERFGDSLKNNFNQLNPFSGEKTFRMK